MDNNSGNVYVVEQGNHRIQKFTSSGNFILKWGKNGGDGTSGSGDGEFNDPRGVAVDNNSGNVYVADRGNHRIQKFGPPSIIPTLTEWGIILLILALAVAAIIQVKKLRLSEHRA